MNFTGIHLDIFLIRHAQPRSPLNHWTSPTAPLSELGFKQAEKLAQRLKYIQFDTLISSPLLRAQETAGRIQEKYEINPWVAEIDLGELGGMDKNQVSTKYPNLPLIPPLSSKIPSPLVNRLLNSNKDFVFPNGESLHGFWYRVSYGFEQFLKKYIGLPEKKVGIVGHGGSFTIIVLKLLGFSYPDAKFPVIYFNKADVTRIKIVDNQVVFLQLNSDLMN